jgi:hypothetical protein
MLEETRQEAPKDRWGRYLVTTPDGKQRGYTRVTTIAKAPDEEACVETMGEPNGRHRLNTTLRSTCASINKT